MPSSTEILFALGLGDQVVAVTHECDYPPEALTKPKVTRSEISPALSSIEIDFRVRQQLENIGTLYQLDVELLDSLSPDIIFTQQLCTVCAVSYDNVFRVAQKIKSKPKVVNLEPQSLEGIFQNILEVGRLTGRISKANNVVNELQGRVERVRKLTQTLERKRVLCLEWLDPPFCAGHWIPELVELAGGSDALGRKHQPSSQVAWNQILSYNPDVIVVMCCGFSIERTLREISVLKNPMLERLSAVKNNNLFVVDGSSYFSRPGPRIVDSLEILTTIFHLNELTYGLVESCQPKLFPIEYPQNIVQQVYLTETGHFTNI
ncbi:MAG: cobalamin-binding protein [Ignavibacteriae bacterium]|nr:cobalamin-binding protein [Ignavibacteriota bacterium]